MKRLSHAIMFLGAALLCASQAPAGERADVCPPCLAFDRLDRQIRDGLLPKAEARQQFAVRINALDTCLARRTPPPWPVDHRVFPLRGYDLATAGADAAKGYITAGYNYFDGNRHGGHPSFDLFIADRNRDSLDDRTGEPVTVVSMTGGIVVAAETAWDTGSRLRGGKYLWVYDHTRQELVYYAHHDRLLVKVGDSVTPGTPIATVGRSGLNAAKKRSPTHLHLTILKIRDGRPVPENILPAICAGN